MSNRYRLLLILIAAIKRMNLDYRIVGSDEPQDRDTAIVLGKEPRSVYLRVTNDGIEIYHSFLAMHEDMLQADVLASTAMAAIDVQITE